MNRKFYRLNQSQRLTICQSESNTYQRRLNMKINGKTVKKENLPFKICLTCQRAFVWRKKWEKNWEELKYCSDRCGNR